MTEIATYNNSIQKRAFDLLISLIGLVMIFPIILLISILILAFSGTPIFFTQKRSGIYGKTFSIIKFRTMQRGAENKRSYYKKLNEADGPVFKIHDDPRFTRIGKILSRLSLDEIPQLINVIRGDMSLVGPRPLPLYESRKLTKNQKLREMVKPGMTSSWVVKGSHQLSFKKWMQLDKEYVEKSSFMNDIYILLDTFNIIFNLIKKKLTRLTIG